MRADVYLFTKKYSESREKAKRLIEEGKVRIDSATVSKPSFEVDENIPHEVETDDEGYVSRGGYKLEAAVRAFSVDPRGMKAIDIGASSGGFTDFLLRNGASLVYAVDGGRGQLHESLRKNEKVRNIEGFNCRNLSDDGMIAAAGIPKDFDLAVMDVSFISQTYILRGISNVLNENGIIISLIKPQFEAGRNAVSKRGIVRDPKDRLASVKRILGCARENGYGFSGIIKSPIAGGDGNAEYLACFGMKSKGTYPGDGDIAAIL